MVLYRSTDGLHKFRLMASTSRTWATAVAVTEGIYIVESVLFGMVFIPSFITISSGVHVILRFLPQQFQRLQCWYYDGRDLLSVALRLPQTAWYIYQVSWRSVQAFRSLLSGIKIQTQRVRWSHKSTLNFSNKKVD